MKPLSLFLFTLLIYISYAQAEVKNKDYQIHARIGLLNGTFTGSGQANGSFAVPTSLDLELEIFSKSKRSWLVRSIVAVEVDSSRLRYMYAGLGQRYYLGNPGMKLMSVEGLGSFKITPKWRYYLQWDAGISQVLVIPFGLVLASYSALFEGAFGGGVIYKFTENFGLEAHLGGSYGFGFSTVTVVGRTMRLLIGASLYF